MLGILLNDIGHLVQDGGPLIDGGVFPGLEGGPGGVHRRVHIGFGGLGADCQVGPRGGAAGGKGGPVAGRHPFAVDVQTILFLQKLFHKYTPFHFWQPRLRVKINRLV